MKTFLTSSFFIFTSSLLFAFGPSGWNPGGGGGQQPGGGGNQPGIPGGGGNQPDVPGGGGGDQPGGGGQPGGSNAFIYDTFITDSTGVGIDVMNGVWISTDRTRASIVSNSNLVQMAVGAAAGSTALTNVDLRASTALTEIPSCAFAGCENLETVILPMSVTNIASDAFIGCPKFGSVSYGDGSVDPGTPGEGGEGGSETPPDKPGEGGEGGEGGGETPPDQPGEGGEGGEGGGETPPDKPGEGGGTEEPALTGVLTLNGGSDSRDGGTLESTNSDENVILVQSNATLTVSNCTLNKSGDCSNADNSNFFAVNAVVAAKSGATNYIDHSSLYSNAEGANGLFASGEGSTIYAYDCTITSTKSSSRGLDATYEGTVIGSKLTINTAGDHCAAVATDRGNGYISVTDSSLATTGQGSPLVYSTGIIEVNGVTGTATGAQIAGIEGLSTIRIRNSSLSGSEKKASEPVANGVIIYQSMSGDSTEGTATFEVSDSTLTSAITNGALFYITNTKGDITVQNTALDFDAANNCLIKVAGNDGSNGWGTAGANGAEVVFTAIDQTLSGNISVDGISSLDLYLTNATYTGTFVQDTTHTGNGGVDLFMSADSTWTVTADCTLQNLTVAPGAKIADASGNVVSIVNTVGTKLVSGASALTVTVSAYTPGSVTIPHAITDFEIDRSVFEAMYATPVDPDDPDQPDEPDEPDPVPEPEPAAYEIGFACDTVEATEGSNLVIRVKGGCTNVASSVKLYLSYQTAAASDLNLGKASVDGVQKKLAFPLVLTWNAGEVSSHEISIPVKTDSGKEVDEQLTFQLAAATGCDLGRTSICTAILHDAKGGSTSALPLAYGIAEPADAGRVTGAARKAAGKTVTLTAVANSGYVFVGWYDGETCLTQTASLKFTMPDEDVRYTARFVTKDADAAAISCAMDGCDLSAEEGLSVSNTCGVRLSYPIAASGLSKVSVAASGLPTGLKLVYDKTTGSYSVAGIPTVASKINSRTGLVTPSTTKFTVTSAGKSKRTFVVNWTIGALPAMTVGTWNGIAEIVGEDESVTPVGNFTMTATTAGSVSAKAVTGDGTASFSGKGWIEDEGGILWMTMTNKTYGVLCVRLNPQTEWTEDSVSASITGGKFGDKVLEISAYRNPYGKTGKVVENADAQNALLDVVGTWSVTVTGPNGETLSGTARILKTGRVTVAGKLANGKTSYSMSGVLEVRRSEESLVPSIRLAGVTKYGCLCCDQEVWKSDARIWYTYLPRVVNRSVKEKVLHNENIQGSHRGVCGLLLVCRGDGGRDTGHGQYERHHVKLCDVQAG